MIELVKYLAEQMVEQPEDLVIEEVEDEKGPMIVVHASKAEIGKLIGRNGRIATSIRTIVRSASSKFGKKYYVKFIEKEQE